MPVPAGARAAFGGAGAAAQLQPRVWPGNLRMERVRGHCGVTRRDQEVKHN